MRYLLLLILFIACNPVKQVLRDQNKLDQVAKVVVAGGYCANDTTFIVKSDTTIQVDTLIQNDTTIQVETRNDTTFLTRLKYRDIIKSITIHDTIKSVIVDNARLNLIQADLAVSNAKAIEWERKAERRAGWLIILILAIAGFIYLKLRK
jgi:putative alpha-1,2-mannosidase